jgi:hypothetical protein
MKKSIFILPLAFSAALSLTSCHDNIFEMISQEVPLETYQIDGNISAMTAGGDSSQEYLFVTNGKLYRRDITAASGSDITSTDNSSSWNKNWERIFDPSTDSLTDASGNSYQPDKVIYVAADTSYLYMMTTTWTPSLTSYNVEGDRRLWVSSDWGDSFQELDLSSMYNSDFEDLIDDNPSSYYNQKPSVLALDLIFANNTDHNNADQRRAYIRMNYHYDSNTKSESNAGYYPGQVYRLNGTSTPSAVSSNGAVTSSNTYINSTAVSCCYYNGEDYFSPYYAFTANDDYIYFSKNNKYIYYADGWDDTNKCFTNGGTEVTTSYCSSTPGISIIYALGVCNDYLIAGTVSGAFQVALSTASVPASSTTSSKVNLTSIFTSTFQVNPIFVYNSSLSIYNTDIWAAAKIRGSISSSTHGVFDEVGLYAYYPGRSTWNADGTADETSEGN